MYEVCEMMYFSVLRLQVGGGGGGRGGGCFRDNLSPRRMGDLAWSCSRGFSGALSPQSAPLITALLLLSCWRRRAITTAPWVDAAVPRARKTWLATMWLAFDFLYKRRTSSSKQRLEAAVFFSFASLSLSLLTSFFSGRQRRRRCQQSGAG